MSIWNGWSVSQHAASLLGSQLRRNGLRQRPKRRKPKIARGPLFVRGRYPNHVRAIDFPFDETADGRPVKVLNVTDEFTREALATNAARWITAAGAMTVLDQIREVRGAPQFLRVDNGLEFIADTLRDWCREQYIQANLLRHRFALAKRLHRIIQLETDRRTIDPKVLSSMWEIRFMPEEHHSNYYYCRPHGALAYQTPVVSATKWQTENSVFA